MQYIFTHSSYMYCLSFMCTTYVRRCSSYIRTYVLSIHMYLGFSLCMYSSPCSKLTLHSDCCMAFGSCREVLPSFCELLELHASNPVSVFSKPLYSDMCVLYMYKCRYICMYVYVYAYIVHTYVGTYIHTYICINVSAAV